jgi:uncharacterized protein (TIGR01777 family)
MKILITGATGFVGKALTQKLLERGYQINILTRNADRAAKCFPGNKVQAFEWKNNLDLPPKEAFIGINGVINLMGENIAAKRWSDEQKRLLIQSRVDATKNLVTQIENTSTNELDFFISSSAIGFYPTNLPAAIDEDSSNGNGFLAKLCSDWENASSGLTKTKRRVIIRTGVVLESFDGALKKMLPPFKLGAGGPIGNGEQMMSWIHLNDLVKIFVHATEDQKMNGIFNGVSPYPVSNLEFTKALGKALHRPAFFPVPQVALKLAFGEMSSVILDSQKVVSKKLDQVGFQFDYPKIDQALNHIFQ